MDYTASPDPSEVTLLGERIAALEVTSRMTAGNVAEQRREFDRHARQEQQQAAHLRQAMAQLSAGQEEIRRVVQQLVAAAKGVAGTDWDQILGDEVPKARRFTRRVWPYLIGAFTLVGGFILWLVDLVRK